MRQKCIIIDIYINFVLPLLRNILTDVNILISSLFRTFQGGIGKIDFAYWNFIFLYIYFWWWKPYPRGVHYWSCFFFATIWWFLTSLWKTHKYDCKLWWPILAVFWNSEMFYGRTFLGRFFWDKKLLLMFFL